MAKGTYDPKTKKFVTAAKAKEETGGYARISLAQNLFDSLHGFARTDEQVDKDSSKAKVSNAVRKYVEAAVAEFINARETAEQ